MIEIRTLTTLDGDRLGQLITGYLSPVRYVVSRIEEEAYIALTLRLVELEQPAAVHFDYTDEETLARYERLPELGFSFGAYDGELLVGIALAEPHHWNNSLWVWEFHVAETYRGQGIGRRLMERLVEKGEAAALRIIVCETQSTNVPAIRFYRRLGFSVEGIDISYYSNEDMLPEKGVAVFMKRRLGGHQAQ